MTRTTDRFGLIHASTELHADGNYRGLWADVQRGVLVKLRRGIYADAQMWRERDPRQRHVLRVRAAAAAAAHPIAVAGISAAALWDMPIAGDWPSEVLLIDRWRGGGRSEGGVRRTARDHDSAKLVEIDGILCTGLARTALDLARTASLPDAVATLDWCLWRRNPLAISKDSLHLELSGLNQWAPRRRLDGAIQLATHLSDSFGESRARVVMFQLGFAEPELQHEFTDAQGVLYTDFYWPSIGVVAEFDGKVKYTRREFTEGRPHEVVWREKQRQDRLARQVRRIERIITADVEHPDRLAALLQAAGVPRLLGGGFVSSAGFVSPSGGTQPPPSREEPPPNWREGRG